MMNGPESMESALQRLLDPSIEFDIPLLDKIISAAYDPLNPQQKSANDALMKLQENPDLWTKADGILERASNPNTKFFGLQILDDAIRTRYVEKVCNQCYDLNDFLF